MPQINTTYTNVRLQFSRIELHRRGSRTYSRLGFVEESLLPF